MFYDTTSASRCERCQKWIWEELTGLRPPLPRTWSPQFLRQKERFHKGESSPACANKSPSFFFWDLSLFFSSSLHKRSPPVPRCLRQLVSGSAVAPHMGTLTHSDDPVRYSRLLLLLLLLPFPILLPLPSYGCIPLCSITLWNSSRTFWERRETSGAGIWKVHPWKL